MKEKIFLFISQHEYVAINFFFELKNNDPTVITNDYGTL